MPRQLAVVTRLQEEMGAMRRELSVDIPRQLAEARAHGDISDNAEYEAAKERQGILHARISQFAERLENLARYNVSSIPKDVVGYGSIIEVEDCDSGERARYEIVFPEEADPANGSISLGSPMGQALRERRVGDEVTMRPPSGKRSFEITSLVTIHDR